MLKEKEEIRAAYSKTETAEQYIDERFANAWGSVVHETQVRVVNTAIRAHRVKRVLEIAPGPARLSCDIVGFEQGYLCEFNSAMLRVARSRLSLTPHALRPTPPWRLIRGDAFHLPVRGPVDLIYTFRFIRHFMAGDRAILYSQIRSVLKEGGLLIFDAVNESVAGPWRLKDGLDKYPVYDELYRRDAFVEELAAHGFRVLSLTEVIRHMSLQQWTQVTIGPRSHELAKRLIRLLEHVPGQPLEWIAVCQKV
jgi:SAM-dependent methyltransferase